MTKIFRENAERGSSSKWVVLLVLALVQIALNGAQFQIAGLAGRLIPALDLQPDQFAMVLTAPMLIAALFGIPSGALADRFGAKATVTIGLAIACISSIGRINAGSFGSLFAWMLAFGFGIATVNANASKILGAWFPPKQMGLAMGVFVAAATVGISLSLATSALFLTAQSAFLTSAAVVLVSLLLWRILVKSRPIGSPKAPPQPVVQYLIVATRCKHIWVAALAMLLFMGAWVAHTGNLANALTQAKGVSDVLSGLTASCLPFSFIVGSVFVGPVLIQNIARMKPLLVPIAVAAAALSYISWLVPFGPTTIVLLILTGFLLGTLVPLIMSLPLLLPELGPVYAGSSGGIISTLQMAGAFLLPSYVIMPIAGANASAMILLISCCYLAFGLVLLFIPNLGSNGIMIDQ